MFYGSETKAWNLVSQLSKSAKYEPELTLSFFLWLS